MILDNITTSTGEPLDLDNINPIIGYQAEHITTGRLLPTCNKFEVYGIISLSIKMNEVSIHKHVGIYFSRNLHFSHHINEVAMNY